jgi:hypothetical protein
LLDDDRVARSSSADWHAAPGGSDRVSKAGSLRWLLQRRPGAGLAGGSGPIRRRRARRGSAAWSEKSLHGSWQEAEPLSRLSTPLWRTESDEGDLEMSHEHSPAVAQADTLPLTPLSQNGIYQDTATDARLQSSAEAGHSNGETSRVNGECATITSSGQHEHDGATPCGAAGVFASLNRPWFASGAPQQDLFRAFTEQLTKQRPAAKEAVVPGQSSGTSAEAECG